MRATILPARIGASLEPRRFGGKRLCADCIHDRAPPRSFQACRHLPLQGRLKRGQSGAWALRYLHHASAHIAMTAPITAHGSQSRRNPMSAFSILLNLLWIVFGGLWMAIGWAIA